ncbi:hypothetical protein HRM2_33910 [Desulforapulum autotrophicum HRM2]|uniref:Uncharacterized protein n=1 Tax=Desulforapulum autotrophicum (strain ATCC 43914 / DSM 3382 / VKM B-1955 / HRM2) TaxID=177437 RepID=C0QME9_DESAH|nr:hypothetical protein [Desulforapulum autotrophicum]ACN16466.1 hypothetical protein HRM2_33910 [Desulforapulum autotrophicum HRM2]
MKKTILYRLFGIGSVPEKLRPVLDREGVVAIDEGIGGWFVAKHVNGPGKRYCHRTEGFSGCLAVTKTRVVCYTYGKRQINISVKDPKIVSLYVDTPTKQKLCISFESSNFRDGWQGVIEFQFRTDKAFLFREALAAIGAQQGTAVDAGKSDPDRLSSPSGRR